ncbi:hypothetical protein LWC34_00795 [Kibdelosporangium philippinense]|uniref:Integral membrane protein n=1 Tax=Kibdelosporangium philippinense TaxID=211113 RepID=A0ABS8Z081_9PSEU|nr:hypothetical protein [Kibdelosporangium philippinense]MCE7001384.1 hypothetical protein [Kibdelosporangium philippinense]
MSNQYGQQPYPGNHSPVPGFETPQEQYGYPAGQPMYPPPYPMAYGPQPNGRPGSVTAAAVLGFVQAGITLLTTGLLFAALFASTSEQDYSALVFWSLATAQLVGLLLLTIGSVQLLSGKSRVLYLCGAALELAICAFYLVMVIGASVNAAALVSDYYAQGFAVGLSIFPVFFAIMPMVGLFLSAGSGTGDYLRSNGR